MKPSDPGQEALLPTEDEFVSTEVPPGVDRRTFMMRSAVIGSAAVITGCTPTEKQQTAARLGGPARASRGTLSPDLDVVKQSKGPVMTTLDEFYKVGPGPSSSHTIGPMRITYDFYQRCTKLPPEPARQGHGAQGAPLRQPERHRQGARHGARRARRDRRQGAGDRRSRSSSTGCATSRTRSSR